MKDYLVMNLLFLLAIFFIGFCHGVDNNMLMGCVGCSVASLMVPIMFIAGNPPDSQKNRV